MALKLRSNRISFSLKRIQKSVQEVPRQVFDYWVSITPVKSGNARRKTRLDKNKTITANYPYARRLDSGWSKQAPQGMSKPTDRLIRRIIKSKLRK